MITRPSARTSDMMTPAPRWIGVATIFAGQGTLSGSAALTIKYVAARVSTDDGSTAPAGSAGLFANGADDPSLAPPLAYPLDGAQVPHNLGLLEVQWKKPTGAADLFEVAFTSPTLDYRVYRSKTNDHVFFLFSRYASEKSFDIHLYQPYALSLMAQFEDLLADPPRIETYENVLG